MDDASIPSLTDREYFDLVTIRDRGPIRPMGWQIDSGWYVTTLLPQPYKPRQALQRSKPDESKPEQLFKDAVEGRRDARSRAGGEMNIRTEIVDALHDKGCLIWGRGNKFLITDLGREALRAAAIARRTAQRKAVKQASDEQAAAERRRQASDEPMPTRQIEMDGKIWYRDLLDPRRPMGPARMAILKMVIEASRPAPRPASPVLDGSYHSKASRQVRRDRGPPPDTGLVRAGANGWALPWSPFTHVSDRAVTPLIRWGFLVRKGDVLAATTLAKRALRMAEAWAARKIEDKREHDAWRRKTDEKKVEKAYRDRKEARFADVVAGKAAPTLSETVRLKRHLKRKDKADESAS